MLAGLIVFIAGELWVAVLVGSYICLSAVP
jgi:hypothetical protein